MPLKPFTVYPGDDPVRWAKFFQSQTVIPDPGSITDETFANREPASVIGRAGTTVGPPADIVSTADRQVLINRGGTLQFSGMEVADLPSGVATESEVASAISAHAAAADPHPVYMTSAEVTAAIAAAATTTGYPPQLGHAGI